MIGFEVQGLSELQGALRRIATMTPEDLGLVSTMVAEGETMMGLSKQLAPVRDGVLRSSGTVGVPEVKGDDVELVIGYGGASEPYAFKVHENPRAGKTGGVSPSGRKYKRFAKVGQWKFLEIPVAQRRKAYFDAIEKAVFDRAIAAGQRR